MAPMSDYEYVSLCPACGDPMDYCQGHGPAGDPINWAITWYHDHDNHEHCHPRAKKNGECDGF